MNVVAVGGEPATGKSTLVRRVLEGRTRVRGWGVGKARGDYYQGNLWTIGDYSRDEFGGTDALPMDAINDAERFVDGLVGDGFVDHAVLFEGDRLFCDRFLDHCEEAADLHAFVLTAPPDVLERRHEARGDDRRNGQEQGLAFVVPRGARDRLRWRQGRGDQGDVPGDPARQRLKPRTRSERGPTRRGMGEQYDEGQFGPVPAARCPACGALVVTAEHGEALEHLKGCTGERFPPTRLLVTLERRLGLDDIHEHHRSAHPNNDVLDAVAYLVRCKMEKEWAERRRRVMGKSMAERLREELDDDER